MDSGQKKIIFSWNWFFFISRVFFGLDFFKFSGPLWLRCIFRGLSIKEILLILAFDAIFPRLHFFYKDFRAALWIEPKAVPRFAPWKIPLVSHTHTHTFFLTIYKISNQYLHRRRQFGTCSQFILTRKKYISAPAAAYIHCTTTVLK